MNSEIMRLAAKARLEKQQAEAKLAAEQEAAAKKEKQEKLKKEAAAKQPKPKHYFDVKIEAMLPATLTYRVLAEDANQAADMIKNMQPNHVKHRLHGRKELKLTVYDSGSTMIRFFKNLLGR